MRAGCKSQTAADYTGETRPISEEIASLLDQGQLGALPNGHRFKKVAEDVRAANEEYAKQTLPDDNDEGGEDPRIPGVRIGTWFDYTPSGALDIDVIVSPVQTA